MPRFFDDPEDVDSGELFPLSFEDARSNASSHHISPSHSAHSPAESEVSSASRLASLVRSPVSPKFKSARSSTRSSLARQSNGAGEKAEDTAPTKASKEITPVSSSSGARQSTRVRSAPAQEKPAAASVAAKTTRGASASAKRELRTKGRTDAKGAIRKPGRPARAAAAKTAATTKTAAVKTAAATQRRGRPAKEAKAAKPAKAAAAGGKASKQEWEVEQIVDSMIDEETMEHFFRVKWKGYSSKDNTWEPKKNLANCRNLLEAYEKKAKK
ncbi:hypothetical protein CCMA1212_005101 [Trichoderma ghanense]|uniref:Chromo domain-containing protein n=1 Tax=Trichoderma ghanense TaxID=65468 RepID=A0ABY2H3E9_9HYPO